MNKMDLKTVLEELKETHTLNTIIQHFDMEDVIDCFWEDEVVDYLDRTYALETTKQDSYNEGYADAIETNKTREKLVENFNNSNTDDKFRFLCDLFGIGYYDNTQQLRNLLNEIINKTIYNKNENHC